MAKPVFLSAAWWWLALKYMSVRTLRAILGPVINMVRSLSCRAFIHPLALVGPNVHFSRGCIVGRCRLDTMNGLGCIRIGEQTIVYHGVEIMTHGNTVTIGRNCLITRQSAIVTGGHEYRRRDVLIQQQPGVGGDVRIGDDCWIGYRAMVLGGVTVGEGGVVGAGAVVTKDVAPYTVVAGVPARPIGRRGEAEGGTP